MSSILQKLIQETEAIKIENDQLVHEAILISSVIREIETFNNKLKLILKTNEAPKNDNIINNNTTLSSVNVPSAVYPVNVDLKTEPITPIVTINTPQKATDILKKSDDKSKVKLDMTKAFKCFARKVGPSIKKQFQTTNNGCFSQSDLANELMKIWNELSDKEKADYL